jgi:lactate dehydrogenase-like 2-hydroxyacid dehydrogenase
VPSEEKTHRLQFGRVLIAPEPGHSAVRLVGAQHIGRRHASLIRGVGCRLEPADAA